MGILGIRDLSDSKAEEGEKESVDFGVLDFKGLPAYAWVLRFVDIVSDESVVRRDKCRVTDLESVRYEEERKRASISVFLLPHCFALDDRVREETKWSERGERMIQASFVLTRVEVRLAHESSHVTHILTVQLVRRNRLASFNNLID